MDYLKIVLEGYYNENSKKHLTDYFIRECLNAKDKHYNIEEFIDGCNMAVIGLQKYYHQQLYKAKENHYLGIEAARQRNIKFDKGFFELDYPEFENKSYDEQCEKIIEIHKDYIKDLSLDNYGQPLAIINPSYKHLWHKDTLQISYAIKQAKIHFKLIEVENKIESLSEKTIQPQPESTFLITTVERSRMIEIHKYLSEKKYIDVDVDSWLYWFSKLTWTNQKKKPSTIKWLEAAYHLTNVVYLICGNMEVQTESAMKKAFKLPTGSKFQKLTTKNINGDFYNNIKNMINWAERFAIK